MPCPVAVELAIVKPLKTVIGEPTLMTLAQLAVALIFRLLTCCLPDVPVSSMALSLVAKVNDKTLLSPSPYNRCPAVPTVMVLFSKYVPAGTKTELPVAKAATNAAVLAVAVADVDAP